MWQLFHVGRRSKKKSLHTLCGRVSLLPLLMQVSARDQDSKWLTALALLDDDTFIAADNSHNLVCTASS